MTESVPVPVRARPRFGSRVKVAVVVSWAPSITRWPGADEPGGVPRPASVATETTPASIVVEPEYVLGVLSVRVPVPVLTRETWPLPSSSRPEKVPVPTPLPPTVRVTGPAAPLVTVPAPASEPAVSSWPARSSTAPAATEIALEGPIALAVPSRSVPALIVVAPVYVPAPPRLTVAAPFLMNEPVPESDR